MLLYYTHNPLMCGKAVSKLTTTLGAGTYIPPTITGSDAGRQRPVSKHHDALVFHSSPLSKLFHNPEPNLFLVDMFHSVSDRALASLWSIISLLHRSFLIVLANFYYKYLLLIFSCRFYLLSFLINPSQGRQYREDAKGHRIRFGFLLCSHYFAL